MSTRPLSSAEIHAWVCSKSQVSPTLINYYTSLGGDRIFEALSSAGMMPKCTSSDGTWTIDIRGAVGKTFQSVRRYHFTGESRHEAIIRALTAYRIDDEKDYFTHVLFGVIFYSLVFCSLFADYSIPEFLISVPIVWYLSLVVVGIFSILGGVISWVMFLKGFYRKYQAHKSVTKD